MLTLSPQAETRAADARLRLRAERERLVQLAQALPEADRRLIELLYADGVPLRRLARQLGQPPRTLQRRLARLRQLLDHPLLAFFLRYQTLLEPEARETARLVLCDGRSLRQAAETRRLSLHRVRQHIHQLKSLAQLKPCQ